MKVYQFKVKLADAKRIWRRIIIKETQSFADFHEGIFRAFDRYDAHLYCFYIPCAGSDENIIEITHPSSFISGFLEESDNARNAEKTKIKDLNLQIGDVFDYLFDFGDSWEHEIVLEKIHPEAEKGRKYPYIAFKNQPSPPQYEDIEEDDEDEDEQEDES